MHTLIAAATALSLAHGALSINKPVTQQVAAESYLETVCMTKDDKPIVVVVRSNGDGPRVRGGDGGWMKGTSRIQHIDGQVYVHVKAVNVGGTLVVSFSSKNTEGLVTFSLKNGNTAQYDARCVSTVIE